MLAWEWMVEKAREGDEEKAEKKKTRKISQSAQVGLWGCGAGKGLQGHLWGSGVTPGPTSPPRPPTTPATATTPSLWTSQG